MQIYEIYLINQNIKPPSKGGFFYVLALKVNFPSVDWFIQKNAFIHANLASV